MLGGQGPKLFNFHFVTSDDSRLNFLSSLSLSAGKLNHILSDPNYPSTRGKRGGGWGMRLATTFVTASSLDRRRWLISCKRGKTANVPPSLLVE